MSVSAKSSFLVFIFCIAFGSACSGETGIIVALNSSVEHLKEKLAVRSVSRKAGRQFITGAIDGKTVTVVRSPMGKVNNAITAQALLSNPCITAVFSVAPAGALDDGLETGDAVVAERVCQHDFGSFKPYGFIWEGVPGNGSREARGYNETDSSLTEQFAGKAGTESSVEITLGTVVSGDQFISSSEKRRWLAEKFSASCVDMGAAAVARTCRANNVRFLICRVITDRAGVNARDSFDRSIRENAASRNAVLDIIIGIIKEL